MKVITFKSLLNVFRHNYANVYNMIVENCNNLSILIPSRLHFIEKSRAHNFFQLMRSLFDRTFISLALLSTNSFPHLFDCCQWIMFAKMVVLPNNERGRQLMDFTLPKSSVWYWYAYCARKLIFLKFEMRMENVIN